MNPEHLIQQQAQSALQHKTSRRGLFRGAGKGAAGLAIGGVAASLGALLFSSCYPGRSNAITGKPHAVLAARRDGYRDWNPVPYGNTPQPGVEWVKLQGDPASFFAQVGNPDRYAGDTYHTSQICNLAPMSTAVGPIAEVTATHPGSYAIATKFQHKESNEVIEEIHYVDVRPRTPIFDVRGLALGFDTEGENLDVAEKVLDYVKSLNVNAVSLQPALAMPTGSSTDVSVIALTADYVRSFVEMAHARGLVVMIKIHLVVNNWQEFSGTIEPVSWDLWFQDYTSGIRHFAQIAEDASADVFAIGNELGSSHSQTAAWEAVINSVRSVYSGDLTYADDALNYWPYEPFPAAALLDSYGFNFYVPGSGRTNPPDAHPTPEQMYQHMISVVVEGEILETLASIGKPLYLTEGGMLVPDDSVNTRPPTALVELHDEQEPIDYFEAAMRFWSETLGAVGGLLWTTDLNSEPLSYRPNDPRGRPIEDAIRLWYA